MPRSPVANDRRVESDHVGDKAGFSHSVSSSTARLACPLLPQATIAALYVTLVKCLVLSRLPHHLQGELPLVHSAVRQYHSVERLDVRGRGSIPCLDASASASPTPLNFTQKTNRSLSVVAKERVAVLSSGSEAIWPRDVNRG